MKIELEKFMEGRKTYLKLVNLKDWQKIISVIIANDKKTDYELLGSTRKRFLVRKAAFNIISEDFMFISDCKFLEDGIIPANIVINQGFLQDFKRTLCQLKILYDKFGEKGLSPANIRKVLGGEKWK